MNRMDIPKDFSIDNNKYYCHACYTTYKDIKGVKQHCKSKMHINRSNFLHVLEKETMERMRIEPKKVNNYV